jgi:hypothetical protein
MVRVCLFSLIVLVTTSLFAQQGSVFGKVLDREGLPLEGATVQISGTELGIITDDKGYYEIQLLSGKYTFTVSYVGYRTRSVSLNINQGAFVQYNFNLKEDTRQLEEVQITDKFDGSEGAPNVTRMDARSAKELPSAFGDFSKILVTLPGVASNNEFSSVYSVRGGNFDENLVYVNEIPVYRPFLSTAGRQEGLSFVNPEMVSNIRFSAGGWEPKYGDKLSSNLAILYQEPDTLSGQLTVGMLGGTATLQHKVSERFRYVTGIRYRDSRYLLGSTEVKGQYFPTYTDVQSLLTFDLTDKDAVQKNKTKLHWLMYYGRNRYLTEPESQITQFGSVGANFRIQTAFEGKELLNYDVYQTGLNLSHIWSGKWLSRFIVSGVYTQEREYFDVEGFYRICDVDNNPGSDPNDCVVVRAIGTNYNYGRNYLEAVVTTAEIRNEHLLNLNNMFEWGIGMNTTNIDDQLREYSFNDSADFVNLNRSVFNSLNLSATNYTGYVQHSYYFNDSIHSLIGGIRMNYWNYTSQLIGSPRISYQYKPRWSKPTTFTLSVGSYQQFPFYRELRTQEGQLRENPKAQKSIHYIAGMERVLTFWGRRFYFNSELYYKRMSNLIPYDIDNVRIRYLDQNDAFGYAAGADFRINGEFIPGTQSWFSLGLLTTQENIEGDDKGFVRRPSDQHINMAIYFEDHMPNDPSLRIYLNMVYGSGYPVGPPNDLNSRNIFSGDAYYRVDIGLSKEFTLRNQKLKSAWIRAEVLNALGADNTLSYSWIQDFGGNQFAVPNSLSARFLNLKLSTAF